MAASMYNVYVGSETGLLKGIDVRKGAWDNLNTLQTADKSKEICSACWADETESELCLGLRNKCVVNYDTHKKIFSEPISLDGGEGKLRNVIKYEDSYITAIDKGLVHVWNDGTRRCEIKTGEHLHCLTQNKSTPNVIATGGKEADLKVWDINETEKPIFMAKNVKNDWLNLRVPIWVMGASFLSDNKIVTCTGHHQVRVYDTSTPQRRPVLDMTYDEFPLTAMALCSDHQVMVGNTQGKLALLDLRQKGKMVHTFKGFAGAIRSIQCHATKPLVATCGLDRFLRVHDIVSKQLLHKVYLKSKLNCLVMTRKHWNAEDEDDDDDIQIKEEIPDEFDDEFTVAGDEDDDLWNKMEVVKTKTIKKNEETVDKANAAKADRQQMKKKRIQQDSQESESQVSPKKMKLRKRRP